jgi:hypothetical protein
VLAAHRGEGLLAGARALALGVEALAVAPQKLLAAGAQVERLLQLALGLLHRPFELVLARSEGGGFLQPLLDLALGRGDLSRQAGTLAVHRLQPLGEDVELSAAPGAEGALRLALLARRLDLFLEGIELTLLFGVAGLEALEVAAESELDFAQAGELGRQARLLALQRLFGLGEALVPPGEVVATGAHPGLLLLEGGGSLLGAVDGLGDGRTRRDELLDLPLGGDDALLELGQEIREIGQLAGTSEESWLLLVALEMDQAALHPEPVPGEKGDSGVPAGESLGVFRGGHEIGRREGVGDRRIETEGIAERGDDRRIVGPRPGMADSGRVALAVGLGVRAGERREERPRGMGAVGEQGRDLARRQVSGQHDGVDQVAQIEIEAALPAAHRVDACAEGLGLGDTERGEPLGERPALLAVAFGELGEETLALRSPGALVLEGAQSIGRRGLPGEEPFERLARPGELEVTLAEERLDFGETGVGGGQAAAGIGDLLGAQGELVEEVALAKAALFGLDLLAMDAVAQRRELAE